MDVRGNVEADCEVEAGGARGGGGGGRSAPKPSSKVFHAVGPVEPELMRGQKPEKVHLGNGANVTSKSLVSYREKLKTGKLISDISFVACLQITRKVGVAAPVDPA